MAGLWYRVGTVSVTNGSKKVTGFGTKWKTSVAKPDKGHPVHAPDGRIYELDYVESDTVLWLVSSYAGATAADQAYSIDIARSGTNSAFSRDLSAFVAYHQSQMDGWQKLLTGTGDVQLTAPDGTKLTTPSWDKVMNAGYGVVAQATAQADIATAEAAKAAASAGVAADIVGAAALPIPDLWAPLTDDLRLITGHGREVKVGDDVVARMVNFSRSTTATYIGKDGQLKTAAANEPRFEKEGLLIEGPSTNFASADSQWIGDVPVTNIGGGLMSISLSDSQYSMIFPVGSPQPNGKYTLSCVADSPGLPLCFGGAVSASNQEYRVTLVAEGEWLHEITADISGVPSQLMLSVIMSTNPMRAPGAYKFRALQLEARSRASSYIQTYGSTPATRAADVAHVNLENLPIGMSLTIACENDTLSNTMAVVASAATLGGAYWGLWRGESGGNHVFDSAFFDEVIAPENPLRGQAVVQIGRFDANTFDVAVAVNGRLLKTARVTKKPVVAAPYLRLGAMPDGQYPLWGHIRNLRIWLRPLSDEQLRAIT